MFWSDSIHDAPEHRRLGDRVRYGLALARAFLTLEDDYDNDWDLPEGWGPSTTTGEARRAPERARRYRMHPLATVAERRPGASSQPAQVCWAPAPAPAPATRRRDRAHGAASSPASCEPATPA